MNYEDVAIELARTVRELTAKAEAKVRAQQLGELWVGLGEGTGNEAASDHATGHGYMVAA